MPIKLKTKDGITVESDPTAIKRDGSQPPTADIPWNSKKITGLADGTDAGDAINKGQLDTHTTDTTNPHSVTFTQAVAADGGTNITAAEAETLTDGSNADTLHTHTFAATDELAKVSANDTTAGYLNGKLVAGTNITFNENNDGANETLTIDAAGGAGDLWSDPVDADILPTGAALTYDLGSATANFDEIWGRKLSILDPSGTNSVANYSLLLGYNGSGTTFKTTDIGAIAHGYVTGSTGSMEARDEGTLVGGYLNGSGYMLASNYGSMVRGYVYGSGNMHASGHGAIVAGQANGTGASMNAATGSIVHGYAAGNCTIQANGSGATAFGYCQTGTSSIKAATQGAFAWGQVVIADILASGTAAMAFGYGITNDITASGVGSIAGGYASSYDITASGNGSIAHGVADSAAITASATNAIQFGSGTNSQADSLSLGTKIRLKGTDGAPSVKRDGDIWVDSDDVYIRSDAKDVLIQAIIGEVRFLAVSTVPTNWLECDGSAVSRTTYADLWNAVGVTYGSGDGSTTFNLPDARGRNLIGVGTGSGLTARSLADSSGTETHPLTEAELASHKHNVNCNTNAGNVANPTGAYHATDSSGFTSDYHSTTAGSTMHASAVSNTGSGTAHNNMPPFLALKVIIYAGA